MEWMHSRMKKRDGQRRRGLGERMNVGGMEGGRLRTWQEEGDWRLEAGCVAV